MTTQEKTAAIAAILANQKDNVAAAKKANVAPGLDSFVIQAMNKAMMEDLAVVFARKTAPSGNG